MKRFWHSLIAVLAGNAVYFLLLEKHLPPRAQHQLYQLDWGVVIDFWLCVVFWGIIEMILRRRKTKKEKVS